MDNEGNGEWSALGVDIYALWYGCVHACVFKEVSAAGSLNFERVLFDNPCVGRSVSPQVTLFFMHFESEFTSPQCSRSTQA